MKECVLCKTRYQKGSGVTFHKFPTDITRLELWLKKIENPSWRPKKYDYICSKHFSDDCFIKHNSCTTLKKCSIPTIFCSSAENVSSMHESMVLPTPSVSGTRMVTPAPLVPKTIAVGVKRITTLIVDQNNTNMSCRKRRSTSCDAQQSIASKKARSNLESSSPATHGKMVMEQNDTNFSCRRRRSTSCDPQQSIASKKDMSNLETSSPSTHGKMVMEQNDTNISCRRRRSTSCEPQPSTPPNDRSLSEVGDSIRHDHRYENSPKSSKKALHRVKNSLIKSRVRIKVLSQHVKRLKVSVSDLRTIISELKKKLAMKRDGGPK